MDYDHTNPWHRQFLATHLREDLSTAGFTVNPARRDLEEEVWSRPVEGTKFKITVYTTIVGNQVRSAGKDAIRVVGLYENGGKVKAKVGRTSTHRRGKVEAISGVNVAMLLRAISNRNLPLSIAVGKVMHGAKEGIIRLSTDQCYGSEE